MQNGDEGSVAFLLYSTFSIPHSPPSLRGRGFVLRPQAPGADGHADRQAADHQRRVLDVWHPPTLRMALGVADGVAVDGLLPANVAACCHN